MTDPIRAAITAAMERQRLTVSETARRADVPRPTLSAYLSGRRGLSDANVGRLLEALGIVLTQGRPPRQRKG